MIKRYNQFKTGLTLIEIMLSILIMMVVVIGTSGYRYYSALDARRAVKNETASRIASLLNDSWRGAVEIYSPYNPANVLPAIITSGNGPDVPDGYTLLNNTKYRVAFNGANYFICMSYIQLEQDDTDPVHKRFALTTIVSWPITVDETNYSSTDREFILTTYVEQRI